MYNNIEYILSVNLFFLLKKAKNSLHPLPVKRNSRSQAEAAV